MRPVLAPGSFSRRLRVRGFSVEYHFAGEVSAAYRRALSAARPRYPSRTWGDMPDAEREALRALYAHRRRGPLAGLSARERRAIVYHPIDDAT